MMDKLDKILAKLTDDEKRELRARIKFKRGPKGRQKNSYMTAVRLAAGAVQNLRADWQDHPSKRNVPKRIWGPAIDAEIAKSEALLERAGKKGHETVFAAIYFRIFNVPYRTRVPNWRWADDEKPAKKVPSASLRK